MRDFIVGILCMLWGILVGVNSTKSDRCACCEYAKKKKKKHQEKHGCCGGH